MGRLINAITGKNNALVLGKRQDRKAVVTGRPTVTLRTFLAARSGLARLSARVGTCLVAMRHRHAMPVALGATCATEPTGSRARWRWQRWLSRPGYPRGGGRS